MANGSGSSSPLWYSVGAIILVLLMMVAIVSIHPLDFKPPAACAEGECEHGPASTSHEAEPAGEHEAPPATSHAAPPASHEE